MEDTATVEVPVRDNRSDAVLLETGEFEIVRKLRSEILSTHAKMYPWVYITRTKVGDKDNYVLSVANMYGGKLPIDHLRDINATVVESLEKFTDPSLS